MRRGLRGFAMALIAVLALMAGLQAPASAATVTVPANADSFVVSTAPSGNRGTATSLKIRNNTKITYMRFVVPDLAAGEKVESANLRIFATPSRCTSGVEVLRAANDTWGEKTITWRNQPGPTGPVLVKATWTVKGYRTLDVTSAVTGSGPVSFLLRHAAGCAATSDVGINSREAVADQPQLVVETVSAPPPPACADGIDNDSDGSIDHPADPGCTDATDTDETDPPPPPPPACSDGIDNDSDGSIDYPIDPGCSSGTDTNETDPTTGSVIATAGDVVCDPGSIDFGGTRPTVCQHRATADLLSEADAVLALGDLQYTNGALDKFMTGYDPSWGRYAPITYPAAGNHEYSTPNGQGYFDYWTSKGRPTGGVGAGYYSVDLGSWRVIALNSNCVQVPCAEGSAQNDFLEQALVTTQPCILAFWHHPLFNSGSVHGAEIQAGMPAFWDDLFAAHADVVLNGHEHNYQRYAQQDPAGQATSNGIREFVVGTGGKSHYGLLAAKDPNYQFGNATDFGVLKLRLGDNSYSWDFVAANGTVLDAGGPVPCN
jgi:hypothetical protein